MDNRALQLLDCFPSSLLGPQDRRIQINFWRNITSCLWLSWYRPQYFLLSTKRNHKYWRPRNNIMQFSIMIPVHRFMCEFVTWLKPLRNGDLTQQRTNGANFSCMSSSLPYETLIGTNVALRVTTSPMILGHRLLSKFITQ